MAAISTDIALAGKLKALLAGASGALAAPTMYSVEHARVTSPSLRKLYRRIAKEDERHLTSLNGLICDLGGVSLPLTMGGGCGDHIMDDIWHGARHVKHDCVNVSGTRIGQYARLEQARDTEQRAADMYGRMMSHAYGGAKKRLDTLRKKELEHAAAFSNALKDMTHHDDTIHMASCRMDVVPMLTSRKARYVIPRTMVIMYV